MRPALARLGLSFIIACVVALLLFGLMLSMVSPPRSKVDDERVAIANFVRMDGRNEQSTSRSRQQAPQPPQPKTPQQPTPTQNMATPDANLPKLDLDLPSIDTGLSIAAAPTPNLAGLTAGAAPAAPAPAAPPASVGEASSQPGGPEQEVMPLNDVRPEYPYRARQQGIEGHIKLAFTINPAGKVENIRVLEASPRNIFDREARRAAARWRFAPRTENGVAVSREAVKTLHFRLQGER
ncbi:energy transducer TonB [Stutzerimonas stutzeri]|uniref:energy transducer TonB n=1 Tax=Stutzerimonas stutzeri TaxID=316 RepID=UPI00265909AA|nr:energy transducer TonB [Stutzerimonas stutzeri]MCF6783832.1 energy transducer TonB [Stutzerimonas stutzeri]MCF6806666.1 energy transducer TonB [Stutzerimonas stutzeri]